jgi:hypothetical protein
LSVHSVVVRPPVRCAGVVVETPLHGNIPSPFTKIISSGSVLSYSQIKFFI